MPKVHNDDFRLEVVRFIEAGHTQVDACANFGISIQTANRWWQRYRTTGEVKDALPVYKRRCDPAQLKAYAVKHPNASLRAIGKEFGCSNTTVFRLLRKVGVSREKRPSKAPDILKDYLKKHTTAFNSEVAKAYSEDFKQKVIEYLKAGHTLMEAQSAFGVSLMTVSRWRCNYIQINGSTEALPCKKRGRIDVEKLKTYVENHPNASYTEIGKAIGCSMSSVGRIFISLGMARGQRRKIEPAALKEYVENNPRAYIKEIAAEFGCSTTSMIKALKKYNVPRKRPRKLDPELLRAYLKKHPYASIQEIGKAFGCAERSVRTALWRFRIPRKKRGGFDSKMVSEYVKKHPNAYIKEIAAVFGCSAVYMERAIKRHNIPWKKPIKIEPEMLKSYLKTHPNTSIGETAKAFRCSGTTVRRVSEQLGIALKRRGSLELVMLKDYVKKHPYATFLEISEVFGCSESTVRNAFKRLGIIRKGVDGMKKSVL